MPDQPTFTGLFLAVFLAAQALLPAAAETIGLEAHPIGSLDLSRPDKKHFDRFEFVGGLVLRSDNSKFGAVSGLRIKSDGSFTAISDTGLWLGGRLSRNAEGIPFDLESVRIMPMLNDDGQPFAEKWSSDFEGLTFAPDGVYVSAEQDTRILRYQYGADLFLQRSQIVDQARPGPRLRRNFGLEALATFPPTSSFEGGLLALSEFSLNEDGNIRGFIFHQNRWQELSVQPRDGFFLTDADFLPDGDLLILERRFSMGFGQQVRLRRVAGHNIVPDAKLKGEIVLSLDRHHQIDNMEGLSVFRSADGGTRVALISDDNHFALQRTLYLEFEFLEVAGD